jgi:hypothetical protein
MRQTQNIHFTAETQSRREGIRQQNILSFYKHLLAFSAAHHSFHFFSNLFPQSFKFFRLSLRLCGSAVKPTFAFPISGVA